MNTSALITISIILMLTTTGLATAAPLVDISVNDSWSFDDGVFYSVATAYDSNPDFAADSKSVQTVDVNTNDSIFISSFTYNAGIWEQLNLNVTAFSIAHKLLSQKGVFTVFESGNATVDFWAHHVDYVGNITNRVMNYMTYLDPTSPDSPSSVVVTRDNTQGFFVTRFWTDDLSFDLKIFTTFEYVPSDTFDYTYQGSSFTAINITTNVYLTEFKLAGDQLIDPSFDRILVSQDLRIFALNIGLPLYQNTVPKLLPQMPAEHGNDLSIKASVTQSHSRYLEKWDIKNIGGLPASSLFPLLALVAVVVLKKGRRV